MGVTSNFIAFFILGTLTYGRYTLKRYILSATLSLAVGSLIIGFGLWAWTQFFTLPGQVYQPWVFTAALIYGGWTFTSEIPFLLLVVPPIVKAVQKSYPNF